MKRYLLKVVFLAFTGIMTTVDTSACTNIIAGRNASVDGSVLLAYCADGSGWFGTLTFTPAATHRSTDVREVYDWDSYVHLGHIDEVGQTYQVVGNMNEWQLTIGETTCPGREEMVDDTGGIDYNSLLQIALERAKTAREAIKVMVSQVEKYGYYSDGETFSICDPNEAWLLFMNGCGKDRFVSEERTVWVALRVPDNAIAAHANYCRLTKFLDGRYTRLTLDELQTKYPADSENLPELMVCSDNVVNYARKMGWYEGADADFSYNAAYSLNTFYDRRYGEPRVWSIFNRYADMNQYLSYASAVDLDAEPMPLWIVPKKKLAVEDIRIAMRDHYEDTPFSNSTDISGGWFNTPYRMMPERYILDDEKYFSERTISNMDSGWVFIAQMRAWMPRELGCLWFGNDDANMVAMTPLYNSITRVPHCYTGEGAGDVEFSMDNAFWVCNWVSNMVYPKYSMMFPTLESVRDSLENSYSGQQAELEQQVLAVTDEARKKLLTDYCCQKGDEMIGRWRKLAFHLIVKFNDMVVRPTNPDGTFILDETGHTTNVMLPGVSEVFGRGLIQLTGDRYRDLTTDDPPTAIAPTHVSRRRTETNAIYLPSGVQVSRPVKGVNIRKGKKHIYTGD